MTDMNRAGLDKTAGLLAGDHDAVVGDIAQLDDLPQSHMSWTAETVLNGRGASASVQERSKRVLFERNWFR
jgi:hypothetical protein